MVFVVSLSSPPLVTDDAAYMERRIWCVFVQREYLGGSERSPRNMHNDILRGTVHAVPPICNPDSNARAVVEGLEPGPGIWRKFWVERERLHDTT